MDNKTQLILDLYTINAIKFGAFKLKSGTLSPIYLDLRVVVSHPRVLRAVARELTRVLQPLLFDRIAAIPYAALPIGTAVALEMDRPLIYPRREAKDYGTARLIEGDYLAGETVVVIDDVITTGASKVEAIAPLIAAGLVVTDIAVLVDREQGGAADLQARGFQVHTALKITDIVAVLNDAGKITASQHQDVMRFLKGK